MDKSTKNKCISKRDSFSSKTFGCIKSRLTKKGKVIVQKKIDYINSTHNNNLFNRTRIFMTIGRAKHWMVRDFINIIDTCCGSNIYSKKFTPEYIKPMIYKHANSGDFKNRGFSETKGLEYIVSIVSDDGNIEIHEMDIDSLITICKNIKNHFGPKTILLKGSGPFYKYIKTLESNRGNVDGISIVYDRNDLEDDNYILIDDNGVFDSSKFQFRHSLLYLDIVNSNSPDANLRPNTPVLLQ